jgi:photosystem II stability/assembly factor-like uncharacterized protein
MRKLRNPITAILSTLGAALLVITAGLWMPSNGQQPGGAASENSFAQLRFRFVGPTGNRAAAIIGEPGNPAVIYVGAASGGIWKTTDGGINFKPIFDREDVSAVGALAIAPSAHNIVWAGTGEPWLIRPDHPLGDGVYKSIDGGSTWQHMGLDATGHIARIIVDPRDPDRVFVCAIGQVYRTQHERGVFRTDDGGKTWKHVLFVDENTGCSDLSMDASNPDRLFAGTWQVSIRPWNLNSGGPGSSVWVTEDGGDHWQRVAGHGLPEAGAVIGRVAVQIAPSDAQRVYALIEEKSTPGLYRSDDGGKNWKLVHQSHVLDQRGSYFTRLAISPDDPDTLYFTSVQFSMSRDGGYHIFQPGFPAAEPGLPPVGGSFASPGTDNHDVWVDPQNPQRILVTSDSPGASISLNGGKTYQGVTLPIGQVYHVFTDDRIPYYVYGNRQDGPGFRAPSNNLEYFGLLGAGGDINPGDWIEAGGGESGWQVPDPSDPDIVWGTGYDASVVRMDLHTGQAREVSPWPDSTFGWPPAELKYRWHWTTPLAISPHDHNRIYVGSQVVHMTNDGGQTWRVISPDLTTNDKSHQQASGGVGSEQIGQFDGATLYDIVESPLKAGLIWTGSNDGQVNLTEDGGAHWTNVTKNIPNLLPWGTIENIDPSPFDASTAYITVNRQQMGDYTAYAYETTDLGRTWRLISGDIPKSVNSSAHCILADPVRRGMLYLGTDNAFYVSWDDGAHWTQLRTNLPPSPAYWITIQPRFQDLAVATYGRGVWILDDVTPLRNWPDVESAAVHLFPPRPAYRFRSFSAGNIADSPRYMLGQDPRYGADINYSLAKPAKKVTLTFLDAHNNVVRTIDAPAHAGVNRVWWDLRYAPVDQVKLRTSPPGMPWVHVGPAGWRPAVVFIISSFNGPRVAPGGYRVRLDVDGATQSAPLEILRDPHSAGTAEQMAAGTNFLLKVRDESNQVAGMINRIEWIRRQAEDLQQLLDSEPSAAPVVSAAKDLEQKAIAVEAQLIDVHLTSTKVGSLQISVSEDSSRYPMRLYGKVGALASQASRDSDLGPTQPEIEVNDMYVKQIADAQRSFDGLKKDVAAFNATAKSHAISAAITP